MQLLNLKTGKPEDVADGEVSQHLAAGTHVPPSGDRALINPAGELVISPAADAAVKVEQYGYRVPTQADLSERAKQQKYGEGLANELKAGAAGAARGATLGLSDLALTKTGLVAPETLAELKERNPASSIGGELAGAVGSALLAPGAAPVSLLGKAGAGIARAAAPRAVAEGATLASRILAGAGEVGAKALGSAVEGAAFGLGQSVTEAALGDPDLTAEKVVANIGYGALLGGALGGVIKAGQMAVPASVGAAKGALERGYNALTGRAPGELEPVLRTAAAVGDEPVAAAAAAATGTADVAAGVTKPSTLSKAVSAISGKPEEEVVSAIQRARAGELLTPEQVSKHAATMRDGLEEIYKTTSKASRDAQGLARPAETEALLKGADPERAAAEFQRVHGQLRSAISEMQARPELYPARFPAKLELIQEGLENAVAPEGATAADFFRAINEAKQALDTKIPWGKEIGGEAADAVNLTKELRSTLKTALEDEAVWGQAGARQAAFNNTTSDLLTAEKELQRRLMYKVKTKSGGVAYKVDPTKLKTFLNQVNDVRGERTLEALRSYLDAAKAHVDEIGKSFEAAPFESFDKGAVKSLIERHENQLLTAQNAVASQPGAGFGFFTDMLHPQGAVSRAIGVAEALRNPEVIAMKLAAFERQAAKTTNYIAKSTKAVFRPVAEGAAKAAGAAGEALSKEERLARFEKRSAEVIDRASRPEALIETVSEATKDGFEVAPKVTQALQSTAIRGAMFLASKLPQPAGGGLPLDKKRKPSTAEVIRFERYYGAVQNPLQVMDELRENRLTPETLEAVQVVYPQLMTEMRKEVLSELTSHLARSKADLPFQRKVTLSKFLGQPLDSSLLPQNIQANQAATAAPSQQSRDDQAQPSPAAQSLDVAGRTMPGPQKTVNRSQP